MAARTSGGSSSSSKAPSVEHRHNAEAGRHEIGIVLEGHFIAFATLDDYVVAQRLENAIDRAGGTVAGGEEG